MLSKAPPVPQPSSPQVLEEQSTSSEGEAQVTPQNDGAIAAGESVANPEVNDRIVEEMHDVPANANINPVGVRVSGQGTTGISSEQLLPKTESRVQKPTDDRLFTYAAVGLTIAIVILLLKKFMKANGYGAIFMDES